MFHILELKEPFLVYTGKFLHHFIPPAEGNVNPLLHSKVLHRMALVSESRTTLSSKSSCKAVGGFTQSRCKQRAKTLYTTIHTTKCFVFPQAPYKNPLQESLVSKNPNLLLKWNQKNCAKIRDVLQRGTACRSLCKEQ